MLVASAAGALFIKQWENGGSGQPILNAYDDGIGVQTICTGHIKGVTKGQKATLAQCEKWLKEDLSEHGKWLSNSVKVPITQQQYDALLSLSFNVGGYNVYKSTLVKQLNSGNCHAAAAQFDKWVYAGGKKMSGLVKRRAAERQLFEADCD